MPPGYGKIDAIRELARLAGMGEVDPYGDQLPGIFARLLAAFPPEPEAPSIRPSDGLAGVSTRLHAPAYHRPTCAPIFLNGRPTCFGDGPTAEESPAFTISRIEGGQAVYFSRAPVVLLADGRTILGDYSSRYAPIVPFYDTDLAALLAGARRINGTALLLWDDIHPLNYSHWLLDTLPRVACLDGIEKVTAIIADHQASFLTETLRCCGFSADRVVAVGDFGAIRADTLLVTSDLADMAHPANKAAPWVVHFLRSRIGLLSAAGSARSGSKKLYVSRGDAEGRRVVNEDAMMRLLTPLGFKLVTLGGRSVAEQAALIMGATHIVALHGAGLANLVFGSVGARVVEIFPATYGTPAFGIVATGVGMHYATYVAPHVPSEKRTQLHDVRIDIADFAAACAGWL